MFSLLSQGYGTFDGKAKKDAQETREHKVNRSVTDHLHAVCVLPSRGPPDLLNTRLQ